MKRGPAHLVLMAALVLVSTSGPFLVCARMDAYAVVFWRMALSALLFLGWAAATGTLRGIPAARVRQMALAALLHLEKIVRLAMLRRQLRQPAGRPQSR